MASVYLSNCFKLHIPKRNLRSSHRVTTRTFIQLRRAEGCWMAGGRSKISSALDRLALEIPLDFYCVVFTNIIEHTWEWVQLPIINTLCQYRLTFQSVIFKIYSITRNSPTLKSKLSFGTNFLLNFQKIAYGLIIQGYVFKLVIKVLLFVPQSYEITFPFTLGNQFM